jgi:ABC-type glycerol-3-phosphate transport system substrate-binding protein
MMRALIVALLVSVAATECSAADPNAADERAHRRKPTTYCVTWPRDAHGRIARNRTARRAFQKSHPCPATGAQTGACPGYIEDHVVPLAKGGAD